MNSLRGLFLLGAILFFGTQASQKEIISSSSSFDSSDESDLEKYCARNSERNTLLHRFASVKYPEDATLLENTRALLLEQPELINTKNNKQRIPLHEAAIAGKSKFLNMLLENGQSLGIDTQDIYGKTALHIAVENKDLDSINALLSYGASTQVKDSTGKSPITHAIEQSLYNNSARKMHWNEAFVDDSGKGSWHITKSMLCLLSLYTPKENLNEELIFAQTFNDSIPAESKIIYKSQVINILTRETKQTRTISKNKRTDNIMKDIIKDGKIRLNGIQSQSYTEVSTKKENTEKPNAFFLNLTLSDLSRKAPLSHREEHDLFETARQTDSEGKRCSFKTAREYSEHWHLHSLKQLESLKSNCVEPSYSTEASLRTSSETELSVHENMFPNLKKITIHLTKSSNDIGDDKDKDYFGPKKSKSKIKKTIGSTQQKRRISNSDRDTSNKKRRK